MHFLLAIMIMKEGNTERGQGDDLSIEALSTRHLRYAPCFNSSIGPASPDSTS